MPKTKIAEFTNSVSSDEEALREPPHLNLHCTGPQIRRSNKDNLGIIGHISSEKHIL